MTKITTPDKTAIRPFRVNVPETELTELRRRINATKWPERETVTDASQGLQLGTTSRRWARFYTDPMTLSRRARFCIPGFAIFPPGTLPGRPLKPQRLNSL